MASTLCKTVCVVSLSNLIPFVADSALRSPASSTLRNYWADSGISPSTMVMDMNGDEHPLPFHGAVHRAAISRC
jgi:hypothetical protein